MNETLTLSHQGLLLSQLAVSFGAGVLASLTPCVYPILPITLGYVGLGAVHARTLRVLGFILGQVIAFVVLGLITVSAGETLGFSSESPVINLSMAALLLFAGILSKWGKLPRWMNQFNGTSMKLIHPRLVQTSRWIGPILIGAGSALVASPCTTPILASVLTLMATHTTRSEGALLMGSYGFGFSFLFLVMGLGLSGVARLPKAGRWMEFVHFLSTLALFGASIYYGVKGISLL